MGDHQPVRSFRHEDDFAADGKTTTASEVGLQHIDTTLINQLLKSPLSRFLLATGYECIYRLRYLSIAIVIFWMQQLLDKEGFERFKRAHKLDCFLWRTLDEPTSVH